ncbi:phage integrase N-terminal SAM-like domain-containing protein [Immundisolibacter cernigliae]|uniref:phage integrase N-terminal SAM-like domain-containing protein n=1 Tax=Immundisolibacter cernigliae TaxID=1810504 RepID=UPI00096AD215
MPDKHRLHMNTRPAYPSVPRSPRLLDQLGDRLRLKHYRLRTERAYAQWVKRYIYFHGRRHAAAPSAAVRPASGPPCPASAICCRRRRT